MRGKLETKDKEINNYRIDLLNKDEEIKEKEKTIGELESLIVLIQDKNNKLESEAAKNVVPGEESQPTPPGELKNLIERWRGQAKPTRDWTKANQLISELEKIL